MRIRPLGLSDAFSRAGQGFPSFLFEHHGHYALIDVAPDIIERLYELKLTVLDIEEIFITHYHDEHVSGLNRFLELRRCIARDPDLFALGGYCIRDQPLGQLTITIPDIEHPVHETILAMKVKNNKAGDPVEVIEYNPTIGMLGGIFPKACRTKVFMFPVKHSLPCCGVKIDDTIAISADTMFDAEVEEFLDHNSRIIFHECGQGGPHTKFEELETLPPEVRRKIRLYHLPDPMIDFLQAAPRDIALAERRWYEEGKDF